MTFVVPAEMDLQSDGPVRVITLNRPDALNAVNVPLHTALTQVWASIAADDEARAVVLTGAGRAFSAGGDVEFMQRGRDPELRARTVEEARRIMLEMLTFPLPIIAAVNGPAVGLGASLAVLCDLVYIADTAYLADPHVLVGLVAGDGGAAMWPLHTSLMRAKEFLFTGDRVDAPTAVAIGLANRVVPGDEVLQEAIALGHRLARVPAVALRDTKRALNMHALQAATGPLEFALTAERYSMGDGPYTAFLDHQLAKQQSAPSNRPSGPRP